MQGTRTCRSALTSDGSRSDSGAPVLRLSPPTFSSVVSHHAYMFVPMDVFFSALGALAAITALIGACGAAQRRLRDRRLKSHLVIQLGRLRRLDRRITALVIEVDQAFGSGLGWHGPLAAPAPISGHMRYFIGLLDELEFSTADLRAMDTSGSVERLRSDMELLASLMRDAIAAYQKGIWAAYRSCKGKPIAYDPEAGAPTVTLRPDDLDEAEDRRRHAELLFRTCLNRFSRPGAEVTYRTHWPTEERPCPHLETDGIWGGEPRPIGD